MNYILTKKIFFFFVIFFLVGNNLISVFYYVFFQLPFVIEMHPWTKFKIWTFLMVFPFTTDFFSISCYSVLIDHCFWSSTFFFFLVVMCVIILKFTHFFHSFKKISSSPGFIFFWCHLLLCIFVYGFSNRWKYMWILVDLDGKKNYIR